MICFSNGPVVVLLYWERPSDYGTVLLDSLITACFLFECFLGFIKNTFLLPVTYYLLWRLRMLCTNLTFPMGVPCSGGSAVQTFNGEI
jgi:hypothetical protein